MGKHNGKSRKVGLAVGGALVNKARREGRNGGAAAYLYTTDVGSKGNTMQSVIENNDLQEMMSMAELADRDFSAEKSQHVVVISTGAATTADAERTAADRAAAEAQHRHRLRIPRRPPWDETTTPEQLDAQERHTFLEWRRDLAALESDDIVVLTPFEKNLEVWRQLWRVIERSDAVVQVVDARDPLTYRSEDLETYCQEIDESKRCMLLLNKADLLPEALRSAWADYFDGLGLRYAFWSAKTASAAEGDKTDGSDAAQATGKIEDTKDPRARLLNVDELLELLEQEAAEAVGQAEVHPGRRDERFVVGLTGYPNVGKSSTINALFGSKKTAVAATPGKTKHFQTLNVSDTLCICDCPGLVMPQFAHSKAEMVAAGVIPIDRLTDVRAPVGTVAARVSRQQLELVYGIRLPQPTSGEDPNRPPTAPELLRALALSRGWIGGSGHPDETRAGRRILKDYVDGRILACKPPPGASPEIIAFAEAIAGRKTMRPPSYTTPKGGADGERAEDSRVAEGDAESDSQSGSDIGDGDNLTSRSARDVIGDRAVVDVLDDADLDLLETLDVSGKEAKPVRAAHKFHKKPMRTKARSGGARGQSAGYDGAPAEFGVKGGIVRT